MPKERIFRTSGMIIHPRFYAPQRLHVAAERQRLGLHPQRPTGLVLFGGHGSSIMHQIAEHLEPLHDQLQFIFLCGHNAALAETLRHLLEEAPLEQTEQRCLAHFLHVTRSLRPKLIQCYDVVGIPRTNNDMEGFSFSDQDQLPAVSGRKNWNRYLLRYGRRVAYYEARVRMDQGMDGLWIFQRVICLTIYRLSTTMQVSSTLVEKTGKSRTCVILSAAEHLISSPEIFRCAQRDRLSSDG